MAEHKSMKALAQEALDVQNACNMCGIAQGFGRAMLALVHHLDTEGTTEWNTHPITQMWACKIHDLSRMDYEVSTLRKAEEACSKLAAGPSDPTAYTGRRWTAAQLSELPTLESGQHANVKLMNIERIDGRWYHVHVSLSRMKKADGARWDNGVTIERRVTDGPEGWELIAEYDGGPVPDGPVG